VRTTVNIDDRLLEWAKDRARKEGVTLGVLLEEALQRHLTRVRAAAGPPLPVFQGERGVRPGVDLDSNRSMFEAMDDPADLLP
jgi:hypothetical protein